MPQREMTGKRSLIYSEWHRRDSIKRFTVGGEVVASRLTMIDIDGAYVEAKHPYDRPPVALIERDSLILKISQCHLNPGWSVTRQNELFREYGIATAESWDHLSDERLNEMYQKTNRV